MFAPTKTWRKWHRKINTNQKRFAVASALAASALPALVMARGHRVDQVSEIPLVIDNSAESVTKTKDAVKILKAVGGYEDVVKAKESKKLRSGVGKLRNRRHVQRRGPLVVFSEDNGLTQAFRNLPGVELAQVSRLNLLQLAPGGHLGRFIIWTKGALDQLDTIYGSFAPGSSAKKEYVLPSNIVSNSDITRIINSDEVQSKVRAPIKSIRRSKLKKNPLKNLGALVRLNPHAQTLKRTAILSKTRQATAKDAAIAARRAKADKNHKHKNQRNNYKRITAE